MDTKAAATKAYKLISDITAALDMAYEAQYDVMDEESIEIFERIERKLNRAHDNAHELFDMLSGE